MGPKSMFSALFLLFFASRIGLCPLNLIHVEFCQNLSLCLCCFHCVGHWSSSFHVVYLPTLHLLKSAQMPPPFLQEPLPVCIPKAWVMHVPHSSAPTGFFPRPTHNTSPHVHSCLFCRGRGHVTVAHLKTFNY